MKAGNQEPLYSVAHAARLIGIAPVTLYRYIQKGFVSTETSVSGKLRIAESEAAKLKARLDRDVSGRTDGRTHASQSG